MGYAEQEAEPYRTAQKSKELEAKLADSRHHFDVLKSDWQAGEDLIIELQAKLLIAIEALEYYAVKGFQYEPTGVIARNALEKIK